jgi:hypothetical protein
MRGARTSFVPYLTAYGPISIGPWRNVSVRSAAPAGAAAAARNESAASAAMTMRRRLMPAD